MNEGINKGYHIGEEAINECLADKKIGFKEISQQTAGKVFQQAEQGTTFIVPDDNIKIVYEDHAKSIGRSDLKFEVGQ